MTGNQKGNILLPIILAVFVAALVGGGIYLKNKQVTTPTSTPLASSAPQPQQTNSPSPTPNPSTKPSPTPKASPSQSTSKNIIISGFAYDDRTDDGLFNSDDPKLPNMQISYYDSKYPDKAVTTFTDSSGSFSVSLTVLGNLVLKPQTYNNFRPKINSFQYDKSTSGAQISFRSTSAPVTSQSGIIEGDIFNDSNRNKTRDSGETSVYFYKLYLIDSNGNYYNTVEDAQATDTGGHFKYINLPLPETFTLKLSNPTGDYTIETSEVNISLTGVKTESKDLQVPVVKN